MSETHADFIPVEEYLSWGEKDVRYEYVDGAVFAMSGGTRINPCAGGLRLPGR